MRRKRPEDVLLPPDLPQIEAIGIDVLNPPQFPAVYKFLELEDGRDGFVLQDLFIASDSSTARICSLERATCRLIDLADRRERAQFVEIPDQVLTPVSGPDDRHSRPSPVRACRFG